MEENNKKARIKAHFDSNAKHYIKRGEDLEKRSHLYHTRLVRVAELLGRIEGWMLLDAGCGNGLAVEYVLAGGAHYIGIDYSEQMLKEFRRTARKDEAVDLSVGIIEKIPFSNASFDGALCLGVLEYVDDVDTALEELSRVLRADAVVVLSMQNSYGLYRLWEQHVYPGFAFNLLRKLRGRPALGKPLEKIVTFKDLRNSLACHDLLIKDAICYNFNIWMKPLDRIFPRLAARTAQMLEFLYHSRIGFLLSADFLVLAQKRVSDTFTPEKTVCSRSEMTP